MILNIISSGRNTSMSQQQVFHYAIDLALATERMQVGGKVWHLQRAMSIGMPVPTSFVIPCRALTHFLAENALTGLVDKYLTQAQVQSGKELSDQYEILCGAIMDAPLPPDIEQEVTFRADKLLVHAPAGLAVRSSGIHEDGVNASFAGVYTSYLGITTYAGLWKAIRRCWSSAWSPGALAYAQRLNIALQPHEMAVIVQIVLPGESAGVVFTADPLTGNRWRVVINATFGLAQEMISGSAPADRFVVSWDTAEIEEEQIVQKSAMLQGSREGIIATAVPLARQYTPALSHEQVREVARFALELDRAIDTRVDVEWVMTQGDVYVVQVRPLTALPTFFPHDLSEDDAKLTWTPSDPVWYRPAKPGERLVAPFFCDRWALELWRRHSPGAFFPQQSGQERDFNGYRYQTEWHWEATPYSVGETITWLEQHEVAMKSRWLAQQQTMLEICESASETVHNAMTSASLVPSLLRVRAAEIDFMAATWGAPQWMIFTCEWLLKELLKEMAPDFAIGRLLQGLPCLHRRAQKWHRRWGVPLPNPWYAVLS
jgi:hypothetical protein